MFEMQRHALRSAVIIAVGPSLAPSLTWTASAIPTVRNIEIFVNALVRRKCADWECILLDTSAPSALQDAEGNWEPVLQSLADQVGPSLEAMSSAFEAYIMPLGSAAATRTKAWRNWCAVVTWATARDALHCILPMSRITLQALVWEFTVVGGTRSVIKSIVNSIITRHRERRLPSPLEGHMEYTRFTRCISRLLGTQLPHKYPITREHVLRLLRQHPASLASFRNKLVTIINTVGCQRPSKAAAQTSCDMWFDDDWHRGLVSFQGGATLNCSVRKQDQERKGHHMRFGCSVDPALDLVYQLGLFMDMAGTRPRDGCVKRGGPHARCPVCPPLFPKLQRGPHNVFALHPNPRPSSSLIAEWMSTALLEIGVDASASFSGASGRMGGLTVAIEAGVPEHILWMQSGHAQDRAARRYVRLTNPDRLYDTWRAFAL